MAGIFSGTSPVITMAGLNIPPHDYISNTYVGTNLTQAVYKVGGASGVTVARLTMTYDGSSNLLTVTRAQ
jgi:hypothetical protein